MHAQGVMPTSSTPSTLSRLLQGRNLSPRCSDTSPQHSLKPHVQLLPTLRYLELPEFSPHSKKVVLPLTDPVTRPLCFWMRSVASWRNRESRVPEMTKRLPFRHSG